MNKRNTLIAACTLLIITAFLPTASKKIQLTRRAHISMIGGNLGSRMLNYGFFDTEMHLRFSENQLTIRNMCDGGDTPGFRPHSARNDPWAFPGAEKFQTEYANKSHSEGDFPKPDEWLTTLKTDVILAFFGYSESFQGAAGLANFKAELEAFVQHTLAQKYNGITPPQLALISPIAFQNLSAQYDLPNGINENKNLELYTKAIQEVASKYDVLFLDAFNPSKKWFETGEQLTIDGFQLNEAGYQKFATLLVEQLFENKSIQNENSRKTIKEAVLEKDWFWHNDFKIPNGVHVYGRRFKPFGPDNYPDEVTKVRQMTIIRDSAVWFAANNRTFDGESGDNRPYDVAAADAKTLVLKPVETNSKLIGENSPYLYGDDALKKFTMAPGFKIELFASEKEFTDLANPVQVTFDNKGRLWVAVMPTYPHYRPGDPLPNDKLIILEDTNNDFKADKLTVFADHLHIPAGFELAPEGVYVSQGTNLKLYTDTDGDDKADKVEIILSGFDDHDTHHVISAFCADPSGAIYMGEGVFLHTSVETPYGTVRGTNGGFMRYNPAQKKLDKIAQLPIPNPWGIAFDQWGQPFFLSTSSPDMFWMTPGTVKPIYGFSSPTGKSIIEDKHRVRPTSGLEFIYSRHFPDEVQGDFLLNNTIGFLGAKMHRLIDSSTGYTSKHRMDLVRSSDPNFRPVDMEIAPDGSMYLADWHNTLIGHMQHNARDPLRDHVHGRIYRISYPSRPLVTPAKIDGASIEILLDNLKLPEYRSRYRTKRELRGRDKNEVFNKLQIWLKTLDKNDVNYERYQLEGLWVSWGINKIDEKLLNTLLKSKDEKVRAAVIEVLRFNTDKIKNGVDIIAQAASDNSGRVRMEALVASTRLDKPIGQKVLKNLEKTPMDDALRITYNYVSKPSGEVKNNNLASKPIDKKSGMYVKGMEIYNKEGYCGTCHQADGDGLESSGFPPLSKSKWVTGSTDRLIKLVLHGLYGPMEVNGRQYAGTVPMTPYGSLLSDTEVASVLNYIRNSFGNNSPIIITSEKVKAVRDATKKQKGFYSPKELLKLHPNED
jgi:mono/diheme cytochrome c family protein/glucose/arabinose dehydrogenase